jgi:hypothetical protein
MRRIFDIKYGSEITVIPHIVLCIHYLKNRHIHPFVMQVVYLTNLVRYCRLILLVIITMLNAGDYIKPI